MARPIENLLKHTKIRLINTTKTKTSRISKKI